MNKQNYIGHFHNLLVSTLIIFGFSILTFANGIAQPEAESILVLSGASAQATEINPDRLTKEFFQFTALVKDSKGHVYKLSNCQTYPAEEHIKFGEYAIGFRETSTYYPATSAYLYYWFSQVKKLERLKGGKMRLTLVSGQILIGDWLPYIAFIDDFPNYVPYYGYTGTIIGEYEGRIVQFVNNSVDYVDLETPPTGIVNSIDFITPSAEIDAFNKRLQEVFETQRTPVTVDFLELPLVGYHERSLTGQFATFLDFNWLGFSGDITDAERRIMKSPVKDIREIRFFVLNNKVEVIRTENRKDESREGKESHSMSSPGKLLLLDEIGIRDPSITLIRSVSFGK